MTKSEAEPARPRHTGGHPKEASWEQRTRGEVARAYANPAMAIFTSRVALALRVREQPRRRRLAKIAAGVLSSQGRWWLHYLEQEGA